MRNIVTCYSEHAVKVSDSYCSGPLNKSYVSPRSIPAVQSSISQTFKAEINGHDRPIFATVTWCNKLVCQGFLLHLHHSNNNHHVIPENRHEKKFSKPRGAHEPVEIEGSGPGRAYWDLTSARFEARPEPLGSFYVIILLDDSKTALLLGDMKDDPIVLTLVNGYEIRVMKLISQHEHFDGHWTNQIMTRVRFLESGPGHEIVIRCGPEEDGPKSPVLSVSIDKKKVVRVRRLQWNFRGNQVIFVDGLLVDVMWDVFGWFFEQQQIVIGKGLNNKGKKNCGLVMFRTRSGLDSRLWLEEEEKKFDQQSQNNQNRPHFSLLISASSKNPG